MTERHALADLLGGQSFVVWCSMCSAEPSVTEIDCQINEEWITLPVGEDCLTRMKESGKLDA